MGRRRIRLERVIRKLLAISRGGVVETALRLRRFGQTWALAKRTVTYWGLGRATGSTLIPGMPVHPSTIRKDRWSGLWRTAADRRR